MPRTYKPAPRVARTCQTCNSEFQATPKATRCEPCRTATRKPLEERPAIQSAEASKRTQAEQYNKTCVACGVDFITHKARAARCSDCLAQGRQPRKRTCLECEKPFPLTDDTHLNCKACAEELGIFQFEITPEQQERRNTAERLCQHQERLARQNDWLTARERAPKGYPKMTQRTAKTTLGVLWLQLCAADGAASSIMYTTEIRSLSEAEKVQLLTAFYRLRAKGYHPAAIAKLCPKAILKACASATPSESPTPTEITEADTEDWGRIAAAASLGLTQTLEIESQLT